MDEAGNQQLSWTTTQQIILPMEGFLRAYGIQERVIKKLMDDGVIQHRDPDQPGDLTESKEG